MVEFAQLEDAQKRAVLAYDRNYAVTAGAGSGKTTTFAVRYLRLLERTDADPQSIAAITFTESGATELQERVRESVSDRLAGAEGERYTEWQEYHDTLPEAYIHTIHGFCARLLREYALEASVPVGFDVIEETTARGQQQETVTRFIDQHLDDDRLELLTDIYYRERLEELLIDLLKEHQQARTWADNWAHATPEAYVDVVCEQYCAIDVETAREQLRDDEVREALEDICHVAAAESGGADRIRIAQAIKDAVETYGLDTEAMDDVAVHDLMAAVCEGLTSDGTAYRDGFDGWSYTGYDEWDDDNAQRFDNGTTTLVERLPVETWATPDRLGVDRNAAQYYVALASLFCDLHDAYQQRKRRENTVDFADLIDAAIDLLESNESIRRSLRDRFDYVMLDEVQDTDPRQWELVQLLTSLDREYDKCNVFVVGDEKQSIFRFRGADVAQFSRERRQLEAANETTELPTLEEIHSVDGDGGLDRNFRSLPSVLQPINDLFDELFGVVPPAYKTAPAGISDTDTSFEPLPQRLTPNREDTAELSTGTSFVIVPEDKATRDNALADDHALQDRSVDGMELDAQALATEVAAVLNEDTQRYQTVESESNEPVEEPTALDPSDVAILLRKRTHLKKYERALAALNIPYTVASGVGFYESTEITALRNLFRVLAEPSDDLALFSLLRSPLFGFEDSAVVSLWTGIDQDRLGDGELWTTLTEVDDDQLAAARERLQEWRRLAGVADTQQVVKTWDALLGRVITDTGFIASLATDERGQQAVANVEKFRARLRSWSEDGAQTLPAIVDRIEREVELSTREGEAEIADGADGVRIMTIHDAKGREFPAVFVPGIANDFNLQVGYGGGIAEFESIKESATEDRTPLLGIRGPSISDGFIQEDTVLKRRLRFARKREAIAEEKRILYVAMTRARDHLYLVGTVSTDDETMASIETGAIDDPSSWFDFIGPQLIDDTAATELETTGAYAWSSESGFPLKIRLPRSGDQLTTGTTRDAPSLSIDISELETNLTYSVPASCLGSLIHDGAPGEITVDHAGQYISYSPPDGPQDTDTTAGSAPESLSRAVFGSALHKAMELEIASDDTAQLRRLLQQFTGQTDASRDRIDDDDIAELQSHLRVARRSLAEYDTAVATDEQRVHTTLEYGETYGDIDHLIETDDAYHIIDYKTNKISDRTELNKKTQQYYWQLLAYAIALHQSDRARDIRATLLFTDIDERRTFSWTPNELDSQGAQLNNEIADALGVNRS
jgi:ATP-dependent helicase/nuclease subunit A